MSNDPKLDDPGYRAAEREAERKERLFFHASPKPDACDHAFTGWREFEDGSGGEQVCSKCGMGAVAYTLRTGF